MRSYLVGAALALAFAASAGLGNASAGGAIPYDPNLVLRFDGIGNGHGVGMSQWGAYGRALDGQTAEEIVNAYYSDVAIETRDLSQQELRVLILDDYRAPAIDDSYAGSNGLPGLISARGGPWEIAGLCPPIEAGGWVELQSYPGEDKYLVQAFNSGRLRVCQFDMRRWIRLRPLSESTTFKVWPKDTPQTSPGSGAYFDLYRGGLRVIVRPGGTLRAINEVNVEQYLRGVVPVEVVHDWPLEALRAQAMAARTFAVSRIARGGVDWDVDDTPFSQVYMGVNAEEPETDLAVFTTAGQVITHNGAPINALYFSSFGARTENSEDVFSAAQPWLRSRPDVDAGGLPYDALGPWTGWSTSEFAMSHLATALAARSNTDVGQLRSIDFSDRSESGALRRVTIIGEDRQITVAGEFFVQVFNVRTPRELGLLFSHNFEVVTPGRTTPVALIPGPDPGIEEGSFYYPQTGRTVSPQFLDFFRDGGGIATYGVPLTTPRNEGGKLVQYFEKARLELNPELAGTPYLITLGLLGSELTAGVSFSPDPANTAQGDAFFPETGHSVRGAMLDYFRSNGGIDRFGFPISGQIAQGGLIVQHFQRARLEHPAGFPDQVAAANVGSELLQGLGRL
ncbi:MAG: SpoIID/LytB domain-containing protein [Chloroflexi bacterium]|nr:SpoIID/LytB domain-containing protein [Chloroflexota bacterium]